MNAELAHRLASSRGFTYAEVGATLDEALPAGYRHIAHRVSVGRGDGVFEVARRDVLRWAVQRRAGVGVYPEDVLCEKDSTVLLRLGPVVASCRVVWTVADENKAGFAYGTVEGHPESGEESFVVERDEDGQVWFTVRAFSRPARWYSRLGGPVARLVRTAISHRYLRALR